jgi:hypothetical protein
MEMLEDQEDGLGATSRSHYAQSTYHCTYQPAVNLMIVIVNSVLFDYLFQENKSYGSKNHLHSSSDVQEVVSSTGTKINIREDGNELIFTFAKIV